MAANKGQIKTSFITALTDYKSTDVEGVGSLRLENGKWYKWVQLNTGAGAVASVVNGAVGYDASDANGYSVCTDASDCFGSVVAGLTLVAGITTAYYCWIQIKGVSGNLAVDITSSGTAAVGDGVILSTTDKALAEHEGDEGRDYGYILDVTASANKVHLDCPF